MSIRIIAAVALGAAALTACSDREADPAATPAADAATDSAAAASVATPPDQPETLPPVDSGGVLVPGQTPPTLPTEPSTTSPATSPPPQ